MKINELIIKDIRSFAGEQRLAIRPITYLVGENSTGKTTALACLQVMGEQERQHTPLPSFLNNVFLGFNTPPYQMGAFGEIVRRTKPPLQEFTLGVVYDYEGDKYGEDKICERKITYGKDDASHEREARIQQVEWKFTYGTVVIIPGSNGEKTRVKYEKKKRKVIISTGDIPAGSIAFLRDILIQIDSGHISSINAAEECLDTVKAILSEDYPAKESEYGWSLDKTQEMYSITPIRSKPKRTYDGFKQGLMPEGDEAPTLLMRLYNKDKREWERLRGELVAFGKNAGLFEDIDIKIPGASLGIPFQIQIKIKGVKANLADVGYGISQILPILVQTHRKQDSTFLIQQPELHMHPKGQAALASLLIEHTKTRGNNYVIETHSDYMIDRTRIEISKGRIAPEDVSLIFLKKRGMHTKAYNITFDRQANFVDAPKSYGDFFIKETNRLIGFE